MFAKKFTAAIFSFVNTCISYSYFFNWRSVSDTACFFLTTRSSSFSLLLERGERHMFFTEFFLGFGVCHLETTNERMGGWIREKLCGNTYFTDCKRLCELIELLPQLGCASPRLLKCPRHFFSFLSQIVLQHPPPKSISFPTNHKRGMGRTNQA